MSKIKLTVTVESDLAQELDRESRDLKVTRSSLVEEGIRLLRKKRLEESLKSGYEAMADENLAVAEEAVGYGVENLDSD